MTNEEKNYKLYELLKYPLPLETNQVGAYCTITPFGKAVVYGLIDFYAPDADPRLLLKWWEENLIEASAHFCVGIWIISLYGKKNNKSCLAGAKNKVFTSALADAIIEWFS